MIAPDKHERRFPTLAVVLCVVIVLPMIYVLSYGPASWLVQHSYMSIRVFTVAYWPVNWICSHNEMASAIVEWYELLWVDAPTNGML